MDATYLRSMTRVDRSPMNPKVWIVQLSCGHDTYVYTRKPRLSKKLWPCDSCFRKAQDQQ